MDRKTKITLLGLLLMAAQAGGSQAAQTTFTTTGAISGLYNFTVDLPLVPAVANADELVSISAGDIYTTGGDGSVFFLSVKYNNASVIQLYYTISLVEKLSLASVLKDFPFPTGNLSDIIFSDSGADNILEIPSGTVFTFDTRAAAIPEPMSLAVLGFGVAGMLWARRRTRD